MGEVCLGVTPEHCFYSCPQSVYVIDVIDGVRSGFVTAEGR